MSWRSPVISEEGFVFTPIGYLRSPFREKFGIPRQAGLTNVEVWLEILPPFARDDAFEGLEAFSHIWLQFVFHRARREQWKPRVRPPRLGGNRRVGVFASRSPFRPNPIGLSLVRLLAVERGAGVRLRLAGADLLDATPVLDIKPYLPWADSVTEANASWAGSPPARLAVRFAPAAEAVLARDPSAPDREQLSEILSLDPRPAYHSLSARQYGMRFGEYEIQWHVDRDGVCVNCVRSTID